MPEFIREDLSGSRFERVRFIGAEFRSVNLTDVKMRGALVKDATLHGLELRNVDITGELVNVTVNGVDIGPLVEAELDRRHPDRAKMRPTDPAGFRTAWDVVERLWDRTVRRARTFDPALLHESVDGEWSFIETQRHLVFATECWIYRGILGQPAPWHELSLPWDEMPDTPGVPRDRAARPSLDEVLELRRDRMATVRELVDDLTEEFLAGDTEPADGVGWPPSGESFPVRECLLTVLNEEWEHRLYAERDLDVLSGRVDSGSVDSGRGSSGTGSTVSA
ncbi:DinB family protein [Kutzneria sp. 744]|uniref:DinB family protein n=1 Tax=Kutzneria sp. (strain 744) TaxID=345341 RepID=UPI0003EEC3CE|nr:DinB family protein [Kutzneria sp. 744]EWM11896.1 hypothetical protein KUTG_02200 [Kutzneria sp. 744]